jgi:hypothetical protein
MHLNQLNTTQSIWINGETNKPLGLVRFGDNPHVLGGIELV